MSTITPLPPATPVPPVVPASVPAPVGSPYRHLITDPWIAVSWLVLGGSGAFFVLLYLGTRQSRPPSFLGILGTFLIAGYIFWSMYFGLASCWRFVLSMMTGTVSIWAAIIYSMLPTGWVTFVFAVFYSIFGGGIYHFARRWWLLTQGRRPSFLTASRR